MNEWVNVKDYLPEESGEYLVIRKSEPGKKFIGTFYISDFVSNDAWSCNWGDDIIYWAHLPKDPKLTSGETVEAISKMANKYLLEHYTSLQEMRIGMRKICNLADEWRYEEYEKNDK